MIILTFETPGYSFMAAAHDYSEALINLHNAWLTHAKQTHADPRYLLRNILDVKKFDTDETSAWRDGEAIR